MADMARAVELCEANCVICRSVTCPLASNLKLTAVSQARGRKAILDASIRRGVSDVIEYMACNPGTVKVHESCRILYNSNRHCELHKRKSGCVEPDQSEREVKVLRSSSEVFVWKRDCFFCIKPAAIDPRNH